MHLRLSTCVGTEVVEDETEEYLGSLSGMLIDPDSGKIEGFFIHVPQMIGSSELFLSSFDIAHWGTRIVIRDAEVLTPAEERIRLQGILSDPRTVLGQRIVTESGRNLGICSDVQFNTDVFHIEWLFPKRFFRWGIALPVADVKEITPKAIIIRDPLIHEEKREEIAEASTNEEPVKVTVPTPT